MSSADGTGEVRLLTRRLGAEAERAGKPDIAAPRA